MLVVCSLSVPSGFGKISNSFSEDFQSIERYINTGGHDFYFCFGKSSLWICRTSVGHLLGFPPFNLARSRLFFHLLPSVFMSSILSSLYLLLLIFMLFFHSQKNKVRATGRLSNIQHFACQQPETTPISIFISISISILAASVQGDYGWGEETHQCIRYTIYCVKNIYTYSIVRRDLRDWLTLVLPSHKCVHIFLLFFLFLRLC